jgi:RHS repeat-associated protein
LTLEALPNGSVKTRTVLNDAAYTPFGEHYDENVGDSGFFAGNVSIWPSFMDGYAATFRLYEFNEGRWVSPDPAGLGAVDVTNPQSWNRYAYVLNNPASWTDASGLAAYCPYGVNNNTSPPGCAGVPIFISNAYGTAGGSNSGTAPSNGRNCSAGPASAGQYIAGTAEAATLTSQWASGLGPGNRTFGPDTATSAVMGQSAGVQDALNEYYMTGATHDLYSFGAPGYVNAGLNPVAQFVGSFRWSVSGNILTLTNTTSFKSLTCDVGPQWQRSSFRPMGNTHQTYQIGITCH